MKNQPTKQLAKTIGWLYLFVIILAGFSQGYVRASIIVPGDAEGTALNIMTQEDLFRLGLATDLTAFLLDAVISVLLYQLFKPVNKNLAMVSAALRLLAHPAIASLNLLNHYMAIEVLNAEWLSAFSPEQIEILPLLFMEAHRYGYLIAGVFFGLHCLLFGILIYQSKLIPKVFGFLMAFTAVGYLSESFGNMLFPGHEARLALLVGSTAALGEVSLTLYLLIKGVKASYHIEETNSTQ